MHPVGHPGGVGVPGHQVAERRTLAHQILVHDCLLYTSDAADERSSVDLGGRRIIKKKTCMHEHGVPTITQDKYTQEYTMHINK